MQEWVINNWFSLTSILLNIIIVSFVGGKIYYKVVSTLKNITDEIDEIHTAKKEQDNKISELKEKHYDTERSLVNIKHTEELRERDVNNSRDNINLKLTEIYDQNTKVLQHLEKLNKEFTESEKRITILENKI